MHDIRGCRCLFLVRYDHDNTEASHFSYTLSTPWKEFSIFTIDLTWIGFNRLKRSLNSKFFNIQYWHLLVQLSGKCSVEKIMSQTDTSNLVFGLWYQFINLSRWSFPISKLKTWMVCLRKHAIAKASFVWSRKCCVKFHNRMWFHVFILLFMCSKKKPWEQEWDTHM